MSLASEIVAEFLRHSNELLVNDPNHSELTTRNVANQVISFAYAPREETSMLMLISFNRDLQLNRDLADNFEEFSANCIRSIVRARRQDRINNERAHEERERRQVEIRLRQSRRIRYQDSLNRITSLRERLRAYVHDFNTEFEEENTVIRLRPRRPINYQEQQASPDRETDFIPIEDSTDQAINNSLNDEVENINSNQASQTTFTSEEEEKKCEEYREKLSKSLSESQLKQLECAICLSTIYNPKTSRCGHTFCHGCVNNPMSDMRSCPICRAYWDNTVPNVILKNFLESFL